MAVDERRPFAFMTKTQHYRKITKPLLERKRRARMNLYIDELKDLIVDTMEAEGEHVAKWEKADILEMTVNYLKMQRLKNVNSDRNEGVDSLNLEKFRAGYTQAAYDVSKVFGSLPGLDLKFTTRLMQHLGGRLKDIPKTSQKSSETTVTSSSMPTYKTATSRQQHQIHHSTLNYINHQQSVEPEALKLKQEVVWRPW